MTFYIIIDIIFRIITSHKHFQEIKNNIKFMLMFIKYLVHITFTFTLKLNLCFSTQLLRRIYYINKTEKFNYKIKIAEI